MRRTGDFEHHGDPGADELAGLGDVQGLVAAERLGVKASFEGTSERTTFDLKVDMAKLRGADFAAADAYYTKTQKFWDQVQTEWAAVFEKQGGVVLKGPIDKLGLFRPLFARADEIEEKGDYSPHRDVQLIRNAFKDMGAIR